MWLDRFQLDEHLDIFIFVVILFSALSIQPQGIFP